MSSFYSSGVLAFETNEQSLTGTGDAFALEETVFFGTEWEDEGFSIDLLAEGPFATGGKASVISSGRAGFEAGFEITAGDIDAKIEFQALGNLPDSGTIVAGEFFDLGADAEIQAGEFDSTSPTARAFLDAILEADIEASAEVAFLGARTSGFFDEEVDARFTIAGIDPAGITLFGGLASVPLLNETFSVNVSVDDKDVQVSSASGGTLFGDASGITTQLASLKVAFPTVGIDGALDDDGLIVGAGSSEILDANLDLDGILALVIGSALGIPVPALGGVNFDIEGIFSASFDFFDIDAGPTINLIQNFEIDAELSATLDFDKPVDIEGVGTDLVTWTGLWEDLPRIAIDSTTVVTPTYEVVAELSAFSGLGFGLEITFDVVKGSYSMKVAGVTLAKGQLGPLFSAEASDPDILGSIALFEETFALEGFETLRGPSFTLNVGDEGGETGGGGTVFASNDVVNTTEDDSIEIFVTADDRSSDGSDIVLVGATSATLGVNLTVDVDNGAVVYDPQDTFQGLSKGEIATDKFDYTVEDGAGGTTGATVTVRVFGENDLPELRKNAGQIERAELTVITAAMLLYVDVDTADTSANVLFEVTTLPQHGALQLDGTKLKVGDTFSQADVDAGLLAFQHNDSFATSDGFEFNVFNPHAPDDLVAGSLALTVGVKLGDNRIVGDDGNNVLVGGNLDDVLIGRDGDDQLIGGDGDDALLGQGGADLLVGDAGDDSLNGGTGDDNLVGGDGNDDLLGGAGDDRLFGGNDDDHLRGSGGDDELHGEAGDDLVFGHAGNDLLFGGAGKDRLVGGSGADRAFGDEGNDVLRGNGGDDILHGQGGSDLIFGGAGIDQLFGGGSADRFVFQPGDGADAIKDFSQSEGDVIDLRAFNISTFFELDFVANLSSSAPFGGNTLIDLGGGDVLTVENVELSGLSDDDFVFVG